MKLRDVWRLLAVVFIANVLLPGVVRAASVSGTIRDGMGRPAVGATVVVYSAAPRKGYSTLCPTCYPDSGKRATADTDGNFSIAGLDGKLVFDLVAAGDGLLPAWIGGLDPIVNGEFEVALRLLPAAEPGNTVRGRVVDARGEAVSFARIYLMGIIYPGGYRALGNFPDGLAMSNADGVFELRTTAPRMLGRGVPESFILEVLPRGKAPALHTVAVGGARQDLPVTDGAMVRGRVVAKGKPVPRTQLLLLPRGGAPGVGDTPLFIGTDDKGHFAIPHVPVGREWSLDANSDSGMGSIAAREVVTRADGETVDVGDVEVKSGYTLSGRVVLSDGKFLPPAMRMTISNASGSRHDVLYAEGEFEFSGLAGTYRLVPPTVPGYRLPQGAAQEVQVDRNVKKLVIKLEPVP